MMNWYDPTIYIGIAQIIMAAVLARFTISLARSTAEYSAQVKHQTAIMENNTKIEERNAERIRIHEKYERIVKEKDNFLAPLNSRKGDFRVFGIEIPLEKINDKTEKMEVVKEMMSFWDDFNRNRYLNQSKKLEEAINKFNVTMTSYITTMELFKGSQEEWIQDELKKQRKALIDDRWTLFDAINTRYDEVKDELRHLENELKIQDDLTGGVIEPLNR